MRLIRKVLNSQTSIHVVLMAYRNSLLARILNSLGNKFVNIRKNYVPGNISEHTVYDDNGRMFFVLFYIKSNAVGAL